MAAAKVIDGKATADQIRSEMKHNILNFQTQHGYTPGLSVVLVGQRKDSQTYVRMKHRACVEVGMHAVDVHLPEDVDEATLISKVKELNCNKDVHGILVQLPLPLHINTEAVLDSISVEKDVDGFHPLNVGRLWLKGRTPPSAVACTPKGCIELLDRYSIPIEGKRAVIVGRSNIVGMPVAALLMHRNATVTVCHSKTPNIGVILRDADIVIAAIGKAEFVRGSWLKPGCTVIDVGINSVDDSSDPRGYRLVGDVNYAEASLVAGSITPVPGGVGPMTIAMLLQNTLMCAERLAAGAKMP